MTPWLREVKKNRNQKIIAVRRLLSKEEMTEKMTEFQRQLGLPVMDIMDMRNDRFILKCIEDFFSKNKEV